MAVLKFKCAGVEVKVNDVDHEPPHCHVFGISGFRNVRVHLITLEPFDSAVELPGPLRKCLQKHHEELLEAWEKVTICP
jgi:hypothetical protein